MGYNVNEIYQGSSDHLRSEDIGNDMPTYSMTTVEQKTFDNGDVKLIVAFQETEKTLVLNATNARAIGEMYSPDTDNWNGQRIMLFTMPVEFNGQKTLGIRVRAPQPLQQSQQGTSELNPPPADDNPYARQSRGQ